MRPCALCFLREITGLDTALLKLSKVLVTFTVYSSQNYLYDDFLGRYHQQCSQQRLHLNELKHFMVKSKTSQLTITNHSTTDLMDIRFLALVAGNRKRCKLEDIYSILITLIWLLAVLWTWITAKRPTGQYNRDHRQDN